MFRLHVLQNYWLLLGYFAAFASLFFAVIAYLEIWRSRKVEGSPTDYEQKLPVYGKQQQSIAHWLSYFPWVVILTIVAATVFAFFYTAYWAIYPPNW